MPLYKFEVGKHFPLPVHSEGSYIEYDKDGSIMIVISYSRVTSSEKKNVKTGVLQFRTFEEAGMMILLARFGSMPPIELPFDPTLYKKKGYNFVLNSNIVLIPLVEFSNFSLAALRVVSFGDSFLNHLTSVWEQNQNTHNFSQKYLKWKDNVSQRYSVNQLWSIAAPLKWEK